MGERKGVTLIELLIAIALLGVISAIGLLILNPATFMAKRRDAQRVSDLLVMQVAIDAYVAKYNVAPGADKVMFFSNCGRFKLSTGPPAPPNCNIGDAQKADGSGWIDGTVIDGTVKPLSEFISTLRVDPINKGILVIDLDQLYLYYRNGSKYFISAYMETNKYLAQNDGSTIDKGTAQGANFAERYDVGNSVNLVSELIVDIGPLSW